MNTPLSAQVAEKLPAQVGKLQAHVGKLPAMQAHVVKLPAQVSKVPAMGGKFYNTFSIVEYSLLEDSSI